MNITRSLPGHTPFCKDTCSVKHCELIMCLVSCPDNKRMIKGLASLKQSLFQNLQEGWNPHANVVDPLIEFQSPLIHWACVLGKDFALEWLIKMNFRTNAVCDRTGECAVHRMLKCLYGVKQLDGMNARDIFNLFVHLLSLLTGSCVDLLTIQDNEGNTPFHACAALIISQEGTTSELEYFENCMVAMLRSLLSDKTSLAKNTQSYSVLNCKNQNSETILHILARRNASFNIMRYVIRRFNHVIDKNALNIEGKSAFDIAIKSEMYSVAKELGSPEEQGVSHPAPSTSVDHHIGEWDPDFGKSKSQTSKQKNKAKRSQTRSARPESKPTPRFDKTDHETSEVETVDVDSPSSSSSCVYVQSTDSSPVVHSSQRIDSPVLTAHDATSDKNMDVDIAGMISINLPNVVVVDTGDLAGKTDVTQDMYLSTDSHVCQELDFDNTLSYGQYLEQRSDSQERTELQKLTTEKGRRERHDGVTSNVCSSVTQETTSGACFSRLSTAKQEKNQTPSSSIICESGNSACDCRATSCSSPLIKLIKEEADVATLLQARLTDKRQKLETYLNDYTKQMRDMEKRGSQCCLLLNEYKDERDAIVLEEHLKEKEKIKLLQRIEELEKSGIEPRKRLKFLEGKITEVERLSEQSLKTIDIRNDYCTEVKRKLTDYDDALKEISTPGGSNKRIKVEPLDK